MGAGAPQRDGGAGGGGDPGPLKPVVPFDPTYVPAELRERRQWVPWQYEPQEPKPRKMPIDLRSGHHCRYTDPATWVSFEEAVAACRANDRYAGVGYVFSPDDPFCGVDLDECIGDDGVVVPAAQEIIDSLDSYCEVSPSGRGVKLFVVGQLAKDCRHRSSEIEGFKEVEIYCEKRYFTLTGRWVETTPRTIESRQPQLDALCARLGLVKPPAHPARPAAAAAGFDGDDEALINHASSARNGDLFRRLWAGDTSGHGGDDSGADLALCNLLAFWTGKDAARMDRLFRLSGLFREKWDEQRGPRTYGQMTIDRAIADCHETFAPRGRRASPQPSGDPDPDGAPGDDGTAAENGLVPLGGRDPATGRLVLSPKRTLPTAEAYLAQFNAHPDGRTLHAYGGVLMEWRGNRYVQVEDEWVKQRLQPWLHGALRYVYNRKAEQFELADFESNPTTVKQALDTIRSHSHLPAAAISPSWLSGEGRPPPLELLPCKSLNLHIPTGQIVPATPALFTTNALDFDYEPNPEPPERWIRLLEQLWGDDLEQVELLQEWLGYCLTADTSQHKMLLIVGPPRSGKGTIGRVLTRLVGAGNVVGPTTSSLAGTFGLQPLIGKSLAIVSDARFTGEHVATVVERLLCVSGEDTLTIDRKHLPSVTMKLPTRFVLLTNELPRLNDASAALARRFLVLRLSTSFYGQEDVTLTEQLIAELPGILGWAIDGWKRLKARGHFVQPSSVEDAIRELEDLASPVGAFVRECCITGAGHRVTLDSLYTAWRAWCDRDGRQMVSSKMSFGRDLAAAVPGIKRRRGAGNVPFYEGIGLAEFGGAYS